MADFLTPEIIIVITVFKFRRELKEYILAIYCFLPAILYSADRARAQVLLCAMPLIDQVTLNDVSF